MPFCPPVYADVIGADGSARLGSMFNREDDIAMMSPCRGIDIAIDSYDIAPGLHRVVALDVCNKLVEVHLVSASRGHEGRSSRHFAYVYR